MTYMVGQFYAVPCVLGMWGSDKVAKYWPVMGGQHEDGEHIGFKWQHYHIDWRFVRLPWVDDFAAAAVGLGPMALAHNYAKPLMIWSRLNASGLPKPVMHRRKCYRDHVLPFERIKISWLPKLEAAHAGCKLAHGIVCPHRGYDLSNELPDADGTVTCPLHGLRWNLATGELASRNAQWQSPKEKT